MTIKTKLWDPVEHLTTDTARKAYLEAAFEDGYRDIANDQAREADAIEWANALIGDVLNNSD